jgi:beta-lactamase class A
MKINNNYADLKQKILEIINEEGDFGIFASHTNSGYSFNLNAEAKFDMAGTYKLPMAIHCLKLVDAGKLSLDQIITLAVNDQRPGTGLSAPLIANEEDRKDYTLLELLSLMMQYSDNTATDVVLHLIGGPKAVMQTIKAIGVRDLRVDHSIYQFLTKQIGAGNLISRHDFTIEKFTSVENFLTKEEISAASAKYEKLQYDTSTPRAMGLLLAKLVQGKILSENSTKLLLDIMAGCKTFLARIQGLLPKDLAVCRKTGTRSHIANDIAIISLPTGPFILVIFSANLDNKTSEEKDKFLALIAKAIYDDYTTHMVVS